MFILCITTVLCSSSANLDFHEFNTDKYIAFRDSLPKNHFLVTLAINNTEKYQFYKNIFINICNDISKYVRNDINFSYILMIDPNLNNNFEALFYIYLPGVSEKEVSIYPKLSIAFNTNKIINKCLLQAISLRKIEKELKRPEITRITEELNQISKLMKAPIVNCTFQNLINDYTSLTNELMQYIPENMQKEKLLLLQQQILPEKSYEYQKIEKEILKERENRDKYKLNLSMHKLEKIKQKYLIKVLKRASDDLLLKQLKD